MVENIHFFVGGDCKKEEYKKVWLIDLDEAGRKG
jgi:hypothetical protein